MRLPLRGGVYWLKQLPNHDWTTYGPINSFSGSSSKVPKEVFDRFEKFSFFVILGRLKVGEADFPIVISIGKYDGNEQKTWFLRHGFDFEVT